MLRFLYKIKQQLIKDGNLSRYLLYGLGEIILVVLGILIAIHLNRTYENRQLRQVEIKYLDRLHSDLSKDTADFSRRVKRYYNWNQEILEIARTLNHPESNDSVMVEAVYSFFRRAMSFPEFEPTLTTYNEISSVGQLNIIKNEELRESIIQLFNDYNDGLETYHSFLNGYIDIENLSFQNYKMLRFLKPSTPFFEDMTIPHEASLIKTNKDAYLKLMNSNYQFKELLININSGAKRRATKVLKELHHELKLRDPSFRN